MNIVNAIASLRPNSKWEIRGDNYEDLNWLDTEQSKPTENEIQDEITRLTLLEPFNNCKAQAKLLISATDWAVLPDVGLQNKADFETYRATLRALILNPVADPVFPTEPTPVWS